MDLPPPKNTVTELRTFHDSIESHIRSLLSLGTTPESCGAMMIPLENYLKKCDATWQENRTGQNGSLKIAERSY